MGLNLGVVLYGQTSEFELLGNGVPNLLLTSSKSHGPTCRHSLHFGLWMQSSWKQGTELGQGILCMTKLGPPALLPQHHQEQQVNMRKQEDSFQLGI